MILLVFLRALMKKKLEIRSLILPTLAFVALVGGTLSYSGTAQGQLGTQSVKIAAIVNDDVISGYDVDQRLNLVLSSSGLKIPDEQRQRIRTQILQALIDEQLQRQEADRLEIAVKDDEIDQAIAGIAGQNKLSIVDIRKQLDASGVDLLTLEFQVFAEIAWSKVVRQRLSPRVFVGEQEVADVYDRMMADAGKTQYLVSEVFLPIVGQEDEAAMLDGATKLFEQLRSGAPFDAVARQFSQASTAANGGDMGWIHEGQLSSELSSALLQMGPGQMSPPIRTSKGLYILALRDRRVSGGPDPLRTLFQLQQVIFTMPADANDALKTKRLQEAEDVRAAFSGCDSLESLVTSVKDSGLNDLGVITAGQIAPEIRQAVLSLQSNEVSQPILGPDNVTLIAVCNRRDDEGQMPSQAEIEDRLFNQELSMLARRYLRDLRRDAVVEYR